MPDNHEARQALELAERLRQRRWRTASPSGRLAIAAVLIAGTVIGLGLAYRLGRNAGAAAAMAQESARDAQSKRLATASDLADSLRTMLADRDRDQAAARQSAQTQLATLDQKMTDIAQRLDGVRSGQQQSVADMASTLEALVSRWNRDQQTSRVEDAKADEHLTNTEEQLIQRLAQVEKQADQVRVAVEQQTVTDKQSGEEREQTSAEIAALRRDLAASVGLARDVRALRDSYERIALRRGYVSREEHRRMREEISRLCDQTDALLERVAKQVLAR